jgi:hypothetical protein
LGAVLIALGACLQWTGQWAEDTGKTLQTRR